MLAQQSRDLPIPLLSSAQTSLQNIVNKWLPELAGVCGEESSPKFAPNTPKVALTIPQSGLLGEELEGEGEPLMIILCGTKVSHGDLVISSHF